MSEYINIAKGNHVVIKPRPDDNPSSFDFSDDVEVEKIKYLVGEITSLGRLVDKEEYKEGMLVKCAAFVTVDFGDGYYGVNADDIISEVREKNEVEE